MTRSSLVARRIALPITAALVGGTFASAGLAAPAHAGGAQAVDKTFAYICQVKVGSLQFKDQPVSVRTVARVPATAFRGERIAPTPVAITLGMPNTLRDGTRLVGDSVSGGSTDAAIALTSAGRTLNVRIPSLSAPKTAIPESTPWTIAAKGTVPAITTPNYLTGSASLSLPTRFTVTATVYNAEFGNTTAAMDCATTADRTFAAIRQVNAAPKAPRAIKVTTKKNKAKKFTIRATDADGNRLSYKAGKVAKKAGKVTVKGRVLTFKPRKGFKGKSAVVVSIRDGKGGVVRTKVNLVVKK